MDKMEKFKVVDKFRDELMDKFMSLCNYNDFNKINLLRISEAIDDIYDKCIADIMEEYEGNERADKKDL